MNRNNRTTPGKCLKYVDNQKQKDDTYEQQTELTHQGSGDRARETANQNKDLKETHPDLNQARLELKEQRLILHSQQAHINLLEWQFIATIAQIKEKK
ncbi:hypothetical protein [Prochlorococcus sp. MIT 1306]|uniref:hypothetical protein n=1 Tax=Prochlorococcus sp. MIT 1306 TaxID=1799667 RepID=UPI0007B3F96A|nr:hypothetical protein [Prochlorococcus sp. MIT 1306]